MRKEVKNKVTSIRAKVKQWIAFLCKSRLYDVNREFNEIMERITAFLRPIVCLIKDKTRKDKTWNAIAGHWKK